MTSPLDTAAQFSSTKPSNGGASGRSWPDGIGMVYVGMAPWDGMWKNRHQLMSRFAKQMTVLYVEPPTRLRWLRRQGIFSSKFWSGFRKRRIRRVDENLYVMQSQNQLAVSGSRSLGGLTRRRWINGVRKSVSAVGIQSTILWTSLPEHYDIVGRLDESLSIYHAVDEYGGYTTDNKNRQNELAVIEEQLLDSVDVIIVVSPELRNSKQGKNREIHVIENAVDQKRFESARKEQVPPGDLAVIQRPRLGYSGLIGKRLNLALVRQVAEARPEWSIVLIGKVDPRDCDADLADMQLLPNIHILGEKHPDSVPDYVAGLDVGLLPYAVNKETTHISPLKMFEYLAVGLPIIASPIPSALRKLELVSIADDLQSFIEQCEAALEESHSEQVSRRINEARENTWDHRVDEISDLVFSRICAPDEVSR